MRVLTMIVAALSIMALAACAASDENAEPTHRNQTGPYIGGAAGVGL
jgi:hypothetical protein